MERTGAPLFSWLHLSDIHFGHGQGREREHRKLVLEQLLIFLRKAKEWGAPAPDALFITGDIGFSGDVMGRSEYAQAAEWLHRLGEQLGLAPRDIYLVPGNHDVSRVQEEDDQETFRLVTDLRRNQRRVDDILGDMHARSLLTRRMQNYLKLAGKFGPGDSSVLSLDGICWSRRLKARGNLPLRIVGLNTALLANDDADNQHLWLGLRQLVHAFDDPDDKELIVALSHHPFNWLKDGQDAARWLEARADILLSGHIHDQESLLTQRSGGRRFVHVASGALHDVATAPDATNRFAFNFGAVIVNEVGQLQLHVWPFTWTRNLEFRPDQNHLREPGRNFSVHLLERAAHALSEAAPSSQHKREPLPDPVLSPSPQEREDLELLQQHALSTPVQQEHVFNSPELTQAKVKPENASRIARPGCVLPAVLLIVGAIGLGSMSAQRVGTKEGRDRKSLLAGIADSLTNPGASTPPPALVTPATKGRVSAEGIADLRRLHRVRALQESENGQLVENVATSVFGYVDAQGIVRIPKIRIYQTAAPGRLELHRLSGGEVMIVGYARTADASLVTHGRPLHLALSPTETGQAKTAVAVPAEWIRSAESRGAAEEILLGFHQPGSPGSR